MNPRVKFVLETLNVYFLQHNRTNGQDLSRIPSGYHIGYNMKYLNSIELKQDATGYHNILKNIFM